MAGEPALTKVIVKLQDRLSSLPGITIFVDRTDDEPVTPDERPAIVIRAVDQVLDERQEEGEDAQQHSVTIDLDFYVDADTLDNIGFQHSKIIADAVALIQADWALDNHLFDLSLQSITSAADSVPATGVAILTMEVKYLTLFADWTVIIGGAGYIN